METTLFWIAWGIISYWTVKTFYFSLSKDKLEKLRKSALGINLAVLILFFLPWLPIAQGATTGWELIQRGNILVISLGILVAGSVCCLLTKDRSLLKVGAVSHMTASVLFILTMMRLMPGTLILTLHSIAPIIASLILLVGNVVVLLIWQQIQLMQKKRTKFQLGFAPIWIILLVFLFGGIFVLGKSNLTVNVKPKSLYSLCQSEIQTLPKLPFTYEKIIPTGSSAEQYRKDRIKGKKDLSEYATCGLDYSIIYVIEKAYASIGLQYYEYSKQDSSVKWGSSDIRKFPVNIDNVYGEILKKQGWAKQTKDGGEILGYGLPTLIYYKDMGDKNYYIDVVVGPTSVSLYLLIVQK
ncbi:MAG: hypothetical protein AAB557_00790 [Patescibacteria group bacterium]